MASLAMKFGGTSVADIAIASATLTIKWMPVLTSETGHFRPRQLALPRGPLPLRPVCVWTAPSWQELFSRMQIWSVRPCVRPFSAAHMAAGHNALRGSGPDRKPAFDHASGRLGCPDRRIDRLCITCCSSSQPSHRAGCPARSRLRRKRDGFLVPLTLGHHCPCHPGDLIGERDGGDLGGAPRQQRCKPGPTLGAMDLGIADNSECAGNEQAAQIAVTPFADTTEPVFTSARVLLWHDADPGREVTSRSEGSRVGNSSDQSSGQCRTDARYIVEPPACLVGSVPGHDQTIELQDLSLQRPQLGAESNDTGTGNVGQSLVTCIGGDSQ